MIIRKKTQPRGCVFLRLFPLVGETGGFVKVDNVGSVAEILVAVAVQILQKSGRDEQATFVTVAGVIVVFLMLVQEIGNLFDTVRGIFGF